MNTKIVETISDSDLYLQCKKYGAQTLEARRKFEGLLPEVNKRRLYEQKGFNSIFEFAAKLAGLNKEQVQRVLQLEKKFEDKPVLKEALVNGDVSFNKLARIASIATRENQEELVEKARILPKSALDVFVKDVRNGMHDDQYVNRNQNGFIDTINEDNSVSGHRSGQDLDLMRTLSEDVKSKLIELKDKGIDINQLLLELLQKREEEIAEEKEKLARKEVEKSKPNTPVQMCENSANMQTNKKPSRYINVRIKQLLQKEHGTKCTIPNCNKPSRTVHHTQRFALSKTHDPRFLAPLCKEHHQIAHSIDSKFQNHLYQVT